MDHTEGHGTNLITHEVLSRPENQTAQLLRVVENGDASSLGFCLCLWHQGVLGSIDVKGWRGETVSGQVVLQFLRVCCNSLGQLDNAWFWGSHGRKP
jgi:hypothetical protein